MKQKQVHLKNEFKVVAGNARAQAAEMVLKPGQNEGGPDNRHQGADQWLFVVSGKGAAIVKGKRRVLKEGTVLLIERGESHEIRNTGKTALRTLNFYCPPAYSKSGDPLPAGKP
jgi:mannose-6-phosphate isomerase-like protein (cupin superfamily)